MNKKLTSLIVVLFGAFLVLILLWSSLTFTINTGEKAVMFRKFQGGIDVEQVYPQGFHFKWPWDEVFTYNVRLQQDKSRMEVLSKSGLSITVELSYRYKPMEQRIGYLHNTIGNQYHTQIIMPEVRSATREVIGKYLPEELYSTRREEIQKEIFDRTDENLNDKNIQLDAILIREIVLPEKLKAAIERKLEQEQIALEYEFRIEKSKQEAERVRIEAEGKAKANKILNSSLTNNILKEKAIEATLKLSESPNSKTVIIGGGEEGLPVILGNQ